ncbi:MAG: hypothetical protein ACLR56_06230 [Oscillospiraceae bacterium]
MGGSPASRLCAAAPYNDKPLRLKEIIGKAVYRRTLVLSTSARLLCGYIYVSSGSGESNAGLSLLGHCIIAENGIACRKQTL